MVRAAYGSGKPAYGVGAGNATMVIDETADVAEAARNTRISKTNDHGSGCSADGNLLVDARIYDALLAQLQAEGGYLVNDRERALLQAAYWDAEGHRTAATIARAADVVATRAGFSIPEDKSFFIVEAKDIAKSICSRQRSSASCWRCSSTKASTWPSISCGRSLKPAARVTRAGFTRLTMTIFTGWRWSRP